jgi:ammonia channel protein AmtB
LGFKDAAGCGYIHLVSGISGWVGTYFLGPRFNAFQAKNGAFSKKIFDMN